MRPTPMRPTKVEKSSAEICSLQRRSRVTRQLRGHVLEHGVEQGRHVGAPLLARRTFFQSTTSR